MFYRPAQQSLQPLQQWLYYRKFCLCQSKSLFGMRTEISYPWIRPSGEISPWWIFMTVEFDKNYRKLGQITLNPSYWNIPAKDTSDVLANYLYLLSNINADVGAWSVSEMVMTTNSLNRLQDRKSQLNRQQIFVRDILMVDLELHYAPELSYRHPTLVIEEWKNLMFVVPATSSSSKLAQAYHPTDNPSE